MEKVSFRIYRQAAGPSPNIHKRNPQLLVLGCQHASRTRQRAGHDICYLKICSEYRFGKVLEVWGEPAYRKNVRLQPDAAHAYRFFDPCRSVYDVLLGKDIEYFSV